jgi:hypothetical protein
VSDELVLYAVRNSKGEYFRSVGYGGHGGAANWVTEIAKARLYPKLSTARARVTYFANNNPNNLPVPELVEFRSVASRVLDEAARVSKAQTKEKIRKEKRKAEQAARELAWAQQQLAEAQAKIRKLTTESRGPG